MRMEEYPTLVRLARKYLCVPATSAQADRFLLDGVAAQQTEAQSVWGECPDADVLEGQPGVVMDVYLR